VSAPVLVAAGLVAGYEPGAPVVNGASASVAAGEILALLGPNGAGKSTFVKAIAGLVPLVAGSVTVAGTEVTRSPAHRRPAAGLAYVPQVENVFTTLTVEENIALAAPPGRGARAAAVGQALAMFPELSPALGREAGRLSGGQRQMLAVARALVVAPRALILDEPSAGLAPKVVGELFARLRTIALGGVAILLVEQNVRAALGLADRALVLVQGCNRLEGRAADIAADPALGALYLGADSGQAA
jgi:branched-chain amino acid transport system ATP-binding protein